MHAGAVAQVDDDQHPLAARGQSKRDSSSLFLPHAHASGDLGDTAAGAGTGSNGDAAGTSADSSSAGASTSALLHLTGANHGDTDDLVGAGGGQLDWGGAQHGSGFLRSTNSSSGRRRRGGGDGSGNGGAKQPRRVTDIAALFGATSPAGGGGGGGAGDDSGSTGEAGEGGTGSAEEGADGAGTGDQAGAGAGGAGGGAGASQAGNKHTSSDSSGDGAASAGLSGKKKKKSSLFAGMAEVSPEKRSEPKAPVRTPLAPLWERQVVIDASSPLSLVAGFNGSRRQGLVLSLHAHSSGRWLEEGSSPVHRSHTSGTGGDWGRRRSCGTPHPAPRPSRFLCFIFVTHRRAAQTSLHEFMDGAAVYLSGLPLFKGASEAALDCARDELEE